MNYNDCLGNTKNYIGITMIVFRNDSAYDYKLIRTTGILHELIRVTQELLLKK